LAKTYMMVVLTYDISQARTRRKVAKALEESMVRVQKSVFEARIEIRAANALFDLTQDILEEGDTIRMYVLTRKGLKKSRASGGAPFPEEASFWLL